MDEAKPILTSQLASLFDSADGVEDVLEMLLSIEAKEDLKVYLDQLLGKEKDTRTFIENIGRAQRGEKPLNVEGIADKKESPINTTPVMEMLSKNNRREAPAAIAQSKLPAKDNRRPTTKNQAWPRTGQLGPQQRPKDEENKTNKRTGPKPSKLTSSPVSNESPVASGKATNGEPDAVTVFEVKVAAPPLRGKPDFVCGCFGNLHKPLTNCLYCGRISCEREGYSYCPFCGYLVEKVEGNSHDDEAWMHKERLLRYDRESAQRTVIIDDQADYYSSSAWLDAAEEEQARDIGQIRYDEKHRRGRSLKLNIGC